VDSKVPNKSLQHTLNNPLAGLLAELQLLQMEELAPDHRAAIGRAIDLVRRLIKIVKEEVPPG
jgi:signal transduction histidine kinase